jgi:hypothetical protein
MSQALQVPLNKRFRLFKYYPQADMKKEKVARLTGEIDIVCDEKEY